MNQFYQSPSKASDNFGKVASEIAAACGDGRLHCHRRWVSFMPPLAAQQRASIPGALHAVIDKVIFSEPPMPTMTVPFVANPDQRYWTFLNKPYIGFPVRDGYDLTVQGWYRDIRSPEWPAFKVYAEQGLEISSSTRRLPSPDLQQHFSDPSADHNRYEISFRCPNICTVTALNSHGQEVRVTVDSDRAMSASSGSAVLYVNSASSAEANAFVNSGQLLAGHIRAWLVRFYKILIPALMLAGLAAAVVAVWRSVRRRALDAVLLTALAAWTLVATRIVILALIEASSFGAANLLYGAPASYLAVLAAFLSVAALRGRPQPART